VAQGVDVHGALKVRSERGEHLVTSGEVSVRLQAAAAGPAC
jgi:hypothetical protein